VHHAQLARDVGVAADRVLICEDGDAITLTPEGAYGEHHAVPAGYMYVDGIVGDIGHGVLRDRKALAEEGVVVVIVTVDTQAGAIVTGPEIVTRGWIYAPEAEELLEDAKQAVCAAIDGAIAEGALDLDTLRRHARRSLGKFIDERTRRRPIVIPVVMEV
jgi:ribonuclease J